MKKHMHQRTGESFPSNEDSVGDDQDNRELSREKKVKKNNSETEADSCFVVTASNLQNDALVTIEQFTYYLPKDVISSNGLKRICRKIILTDGGERSWALDLSYDKSSNTFCITRGWRNFCDENGKKAGSFFSFTLMENRKTPLLSFCPKESRGEKAIKKGSLPVEPSSGQQISKEERKKNHLRCKDSTSQCQNRFVTLTVTHKSLRKCRLHLPLPFMRENGLDKLEMITLLSKDGQMFLANLRQEATGRMSLGRAWKVFAKANSLKTGESFTLELIWKYKTPMLSFLHTVASSDRRRQKEYCSEASEKESVSTEPISGSKNTEHLPSQFLKDNGITKLGKMTILGENKMELSAYLLSRDETVVLENGWAEFCETNGVKLGDSFTLEFVHEQDTTPVLKFCSICGD